MMIVKSCFGSTYNEAISYDDTLQYEEVNANLHIQKCKHIRRGNTLIDLLNAFSGLSLDPFKYILSICMIFPDGTEEIAEDNGGVTRDCLSELIWITNSAHKEAL